MGWGGGVGGGVVMEWGCGCHAENIVIDFTTSNLRFHSIVIGFITLSSISRVIRGWQWRWENTTCTNLCKKNCASLLETGRMKVEDSPGQKRRRILRWRLGFGRFGFKNERIRDPQKTSSNKQKYWEGLHFWIKICTTTRAIPHPAGCLSIWYCLS